MVLFSCSADVTRGQTAGGELGPGAGEQCPAEELVLHENPVLQDIHVLQESPVLQGSRLGQRLLAQRTMAGELGEIHR